MPQRPRAGFNICALASILIPSKLKSSPRENNHSSTWLDLVRYAREVLVRNTPSGSCWALLYADAARLCGFQLYLQFSTRHYHRCIHAFAVAAQEVLHKSDARPVTMISDSSGDCWSSNSPPTAGQLPSVFGLDDHRWTVQHHNTHEYRSSITFRYVACTYDHQASAKLPDVAANSFGKHPIPRHLGSRQLPAQFRYLEWITERRAPKAMDNNQKSTYHIEYQPLQQLHTPQFAFGDMSSVGLTYVLVNSLMITAYCYTHISLFFIPSHGVMFAFLAVVICAPCAHAVLHHLAVGTTDGQALYSLEMDHESRRVYMIQARDAGGASPSLALDVRKSLSSTNQFH
jgi:hypothetical protein